jgi:hypothetical protein
MQIGQRWRERQVAAVLLLQLLLPAWLTLCAAKVDSTGPITGKNCSKSVKDMLLQRIKPLCVACGTCDA